MIDGINCQFGVYAIVTLIFSHFSVTFISFFTFTNIYLIFNFKINHLLVMVGLI